MILKNLELEGCLVRSVFALKNSGCNEIKPEGTTSKDLLKDIEEALHLH
jgi:hypothetical protein